jgi:hypothetical protein
MMQLGYAEEDFRGKPLIGVLSTWSELNSSHSHFPERVQDVKRGVEQAGGFAVEMPVLSVDESFTKPASMLYRSNRGHRIGKALRRMVSNPKTQFRWRNPETNPYIFRSETRSAVTSRYHDVAMAMGQA